MASRLATLLRKRVFRRGRITIRRVPGIHGNITFRAAVGARVVFAKLPRAPGDGWLIRREVAALRALRRKAFPVPAVVTFEPQGLKTVPVVTTRGIPGTALEWLLRGHADADLQDVWRPLARWLDRLAACPPGFLARVDAGRPFTGIAAADFDPARWLQARRYPLASVVARLAPPRPALLHGSLSPKNLLVRSPTRRPRLAAILDFEAVRMGPFGMDHAMLWFHLFHARRTAAADSWAQLALASPARDGFLAGAAWLAAFRADHAARGRPRWLMAVGRQLTAYRRQG